MLNNVEVRMDCHVLSVDQFHHVSQKVCHRLLYLDVRTMWNANGNDVVQRAAAAVRAFIGSY